MTIGGRHNILFLSPVDSTFVRKDRRILEGNYDIDYYDVMEFDPRNNPKHIISLIREIKNHDLIFGWFTHPITCIATVLANQLNTPTILIAGGYDVARVPEINYGLTLRKKHYYYLVKIALNSATKVLAVSDSTKEEALQISKSANIETIYVGSIDTDDFSPECETNRDENLIITTGTITDNNLERKGLKYFAQTSSICQNKEFVLIGEKADLEATRRLSDIGGKNLILPGYVDFEQLLDYYRKANVYVQPSIHEGFGVAVAESMSCGCTPVVSRNGALPEVVGNTGVYLNKIDKWEIKQAIAKATAIDGTAARQRIVDKFSKSQRERELIQAVQQVIRT